MVRPTVQAERGLPGHVFDVPELDGESSAGLADSDQPRSGGVWIVPQSFRTVGRENETPWNAQVVAGGAG